MKREVIHEYMYRGRKYTKKHNNRKTCVPSFPEEEKSLRITCRSSENTWNGPEHRPSFH